MAVTHPADCLKTPLNHWSDLETELPLAETAQWVGKQPVSLAFSVSPN
jgi:hypothetical protein